MSLDEDHPFGELYQKRVKQNRDLVVLITDSSNDRGTGKTTLALKLGAAMDRTDDGLTTGKTAINPEPMTRAYTDYPEGSSIVLDETEVGLDKYQAASAVNKAIRELVSMGRVEQKYLILNAPADHLVDSDLKSLVDVWLLVERRGMANAYRMDWEPMSGHELTRGMGVVTWDAISDSQIQLVYDDLTDRKRERLSGERGDDYVTRQEMQKEIESAVDSATREQRNNWIREIYEKTSLSQNDLAALETVDVGQGTVNKIINQSEEGVIHS